MRVVVATTVGRFDVDVAPSDTSWDVRQKLHESCKASGHGLPPASEQALVYNGVRLSDRLQHSLQAEGVPDGALLVMLRKRTQPEPPPQRQAVRPTLAEVDAAVRAEAARQGRTVRAPTITRSHAAHPYESRLQGIMRALNNMGDDEEGLGELQRHVALALRHADAFPPGAADAAAAPPAAAPPEEVVVPEPSAEDMQRLGDMGFSAAAARRALLLHRGDMQLAANYLIAHAGDGALEAEPTMDELRTVYRGRNVRLAAPRRVEAAAEGLEMLAAMGFNAAAARHALVRCDNDVEAAVNVLASLPAGWTPPEAEGDAVVAAPGAAPEPAPTRDPVAGPAEAAAAPDDGGAAADAASAGASRDGGGSTGGSEGPPGLTRSLSNPGSGDYSGAMPELESSSEQSRSSAAASLPPLERDSSSDSLASSAAGGSSLPGLAAPGSTSSDSTLSGAAQDARGADSGSGTTARSDEQEPLLPAERAGEALEEAARAAVAQMAAGLDGGAAARRGEEHPATRAFTQFNQALIGALGGGGGFVFDGGDGAMMARSGSLDSDGLSRMTGALPILSMGGGDLDALAALPLNDEMRWAEAMPGFMDALLNGGGGEDDGDDDDDDGEADEDESDFGDEDEGWTEDDGSEGGAGSDEEPEASSAALEGSGPLGSGGSLPEVVGSESGEVGFAGEGAWAEGVDIEDAAAALEEGDGGECAEADGGASGASDAWTSH